MHGGEELPVVVGELGGDVLGAHLLQDVSCSSFRTLLLLQGELGEEGAVNAGPFPVGSPGTLTSFSTWLLEQRKSLSLTPSAVKTAAASSFSSALSAGHKAVPSGGSDRTPHPSCHPPGGLPTSCRVHPDQDLVSSGLPHC